MILHILREQRTIEMNAVHLLTGMATIIDAKEKSCFLIEMPNQYLFNSAMLIVYL